MFNYDCFIKYYDIVSLVRAINTISILRAHSKITSHFPISASGHLRLPLNREGIEIVHYSSGFTQSQQPNLTQI